MVWFHDICLPQAKEIRFIKGRLRFGDGKYPAPFPCMIVVFDAKWTRAKKMLLECQAYAGDDKIGALSGELDCMVELEMLKGK